jgi:hypothetical protein
LNTAYRNIKDTITQFNSYAGNNLILKEIYPIEDNKEQEAMMA